MRPDLAEIGGRSFRRASSAASRAIAEGRMAPAVAQAKLRYWLAIAAHAGAELDELCQPCQPVFHSGGAPALHRFRTLSCDIATRAEWAPILAETRDAALDRHHAEPTPETERAARDICALANAFAFDPAGAHPIPPYGASLRRAA